MVNRGIQDINPCQTLASIHGQKNSQTCTANSSKRTYYNWTVKLVLCMYISSCYSELIKSILDSPSHHRICSIVVGMSEESTLLVADWSKFKNGDYHMADTAERVNEFYF
ncbi:Uncharacterised protein r2_g867 [Pycnogonum litorale]